MLDIFSNRRHFYNKKMIDYLQKSTDESIERIIEREKVKIIGDKNIILKALETSTKVNNLKTPLAIIEKNGIALLTFLSVTPFIYYFYIMKK
jgi:hypothetical protein